MDRLWIRIAVLGTVSFTLASCGCTSIWRDVPLSPSAAPKVQLDAAWYSEGSSPELAERLTKERQEHISSTIEQRKQGKVGLSLEEMLARGNSDPGDRGTAKAAPVTTAPGNPSVVLGAQPPPSLDAGAAVSNGGEWDVVPSTETKLGAGKLVIEVAGGERFVR